MKKINTRRSFLKQAVVLGAGLCVGMGRGYGAPAPSGPARQMPEQPFDVIVVGAGTGGVPAAIAAARMGAKVALVEQDACIGGTPVHSFVTFLYGKQRNGIYGEMLDNLNARGEMCGHPLENFNRGMDGRSHWHLPSSYMRVLNQMVAAEKNITLFLNTAVTGVLREEKGERPRVTGVEVSSGLRPLRLRAKVTVDATGTGLIGELAGCECRYGRESKAEYGESYAPETADDVVQPLTLMYVVQTLRPDAKIDFKSLSTVSMVKANLGWKMQGQLAKQKKNTQAYLCWGATEHCKDTRDPLQIGAAQAAALAKAEDDISRLLEAGYATWVAPRIGLRECRRIVGDHVITQGDLESGKLPEDTIALGDYPLDIWGQGVNHKLPLYGIPYRALVPKNTEGMLVAGKAISGTHVAMAAYRVQSIVGPTGQAVGTAAAIAAQKNVSLHAMPLELLRGELAKAGTITLEA